MKTLLEALKARRLKDPAKKARPMRVTSAMVKAEGDDRLYPHACRDVRYPVGCDWHTDCEVPHTTDSYVEEYCHLNHLKWVATRDCLERRAA